MKQPFNAGKLTNVDEGEPISNGYTCTDLSAIITTKSVNVYAQP